MSLFHKIKQLFKRIPYQMQRDDVIVMFSDPDMWKEYKILNYNRLVVKKGLTPNDIYDALYLKYGKCNFDLVNKLLQDLEMRQIIYKADHIVDNPDISVPLYRALRWF